LIDCHTPALPQPLRSAEGLGHRVIPRAPAPGKDADRAGSDATGTRNSSVVHG
jgi:hypothetical protein